VGHHYSRFILPIDRPQLDRAFRETLDGVSHSVDFRIIAQNGRPIWVRSSGQPIITDNKVLGLRGSYNDIHRQKLLEERLCQYKKLEAMGHMTGGFAHEFNNLLAIIIGNAELALDEIGEFHPSCSNLDEILKASTRAVDVIKQLLRFCHNTRISADFTDLVTATQNIVLLLRPSLPDTIKVTTVTDLPHLKVAIAKSQLDQILVNIFSNAVEAMKLSGGALTIEISKRILQDKEIIWHQEITSGLYAELAITESWHRVHPDIADKIFDPYFTTKPLGTGPGMGLAVVYGIVKAHGGAIWFKNGTDKGTTFFILLPVAATAQPADGYI